MTTQSSDIVRRIADGRRHAYDGDTPRRHRADPRSPRGIALGERSERSRSRRAIRRDPDAEARSALPATIAVPPVMSRPFGSVPVSGSVARFAPTTGSAPPGVPVGVTACGSTGGGEPAASDEIALVRMLGADHITAAPTATPPPRLSNDRRVKGAVLSHEALSCRPRPPAQRSSVNLRSTPSGEGTTSRARPTAGSATSG